MADKEFDLEVISAKLKSASDDEKRAILGALPADVKRQLVAKLKAEKSQQNSQTGEGAIVPLSASASSSKRPAPSDGDSKNVSEKPVKKSRKNEKRQSIFGEELPEGIYQNTSTFKYKAMKNKMEGPWRDLLSEAVADKQLLHDGFLEGRLTAVQSELHVDASRKAKENEEDAASRRTKALLQFQHGQSKSSGMLMLNDSSPKRHKQRGGKNDAAKKRKHRKNRQQRTVFVTNIPYELSDARLSLFFGKQCGRVVNVNMPVDEEKGHIKGYAHVTFSTARAAKACIEQFDGVELYKRLLSVQQSQDGHSEPTNVERWRNSDHAAALHHLTANGPLDVAKMFMVQRAIENHVGEKCDFKKYGFGSFATALSALNVVVNKSEDGSSYQVEYKESSGAGVMASPVDDPSSSETEGSSSSGDGDGTPKKSKARTKSKDFGNVREMPDYSDLV